MSDFELELKMGFLDEAAQLISEAEQCFLILEENPNDRAVIEKIFRVAHNLKGSSRAVGFDALGAFTHEFETFLLKCKNGELAISPTTISLLLKCNDHVREFVEGLKADTGFTVDSSALVDEIKKFNPVATAPAVEAVASDPGAEAAGLDVPSEVAAEAVEDPVTEPAVVVAPALVSAPAVAVPPPAQAPTAPPAVAPQRAQADESIRVSLSRVEKLINFVGEIVILQTVLREQARSLNVSLLQKTIHQMGKVTKEVQDLSMGLRMVPLKQTFQKMQRIVRDTSGVLNKKVNLVLEGEDTEVDKTVLEALSDPLVHLLRNACDHGVEAPADRVAAGKPEAGTVILRAFHQSGKLVIEIIDDGAGISAHRLRQKALEKGILKPGQTISDKEAVHLIFHAGFSTKAQVTEVSGRGVGMDVVRTNIEQLSGEIIVETHEGKGSTFKIVLPLTLAIIDGMVVKCAEERFIIPLSHVHESLKPNHQDLHKTSGIGEVLTLRGEPLPVVRLATALGKKRAAEADATVDQIAIVVRSQGEPFAALVDEIVGQYQVVIKKLGNEMSGITGYSGSAILGDGRPALILELAEIVAKQTPRRQAS